MRRPLLLLLALVGASAHGQATGPDEPIGTARPDFSNSPQIVPRGHLQIEAGTTYFQGNRENLARAQIGEATLRYGATPQFEVRLGLPNYILAQERDHPDGFDTTTAYGLLYLGHPGGVNVGLLPGLHIPSGHPDYRIEVVSPDFHLLLQRDLGEGTSLVADLGALFTRDSGRNTVESTLSVEVEQALGKGIDGFLEYADTLDRRHEPIEYAHIGLKFGLTRTAQLDVHAAWGLDGATEPFFLGAGYSVRF